MNTHIYILHSPTRCPCNDHVPLSPHSSVLFWDTRPPKVPHQAPPAADKKQHTINNPIGVPTTFKHLDLVWKPMLKVSEGRKMGKDEKVTQRWKKQEVVKDLE